VGKYGSLPWVLLAVAAVVLGLASSGISIRVTPAGVPPPATLATLAPHPGSAPAPAPRVRPEGIGPEPAFVLVHDAWQVVDAGWVPCGQALDFSKGRIHAWPAGPYTVVVSQGDRWGRLEIAVTPEDEAQREYAVPVERAGRTLRMRAVRGDVPIAGAAVRIHSFGEGRLAFGGLVGVTNPDGWITIRGIPSDALALHVSVLDGDSGRHGSVPSRDWERAVFDLGPR